MYVLNIPRSLLDLDIQLDQATALTASQVLLMLQNQPSRKFLGLSRSPPFVWVVPYRILLLFRIDGIMVALFSRILQSISSSEDASVEAGGVAMFDAPGGILPGGIPPEVRLNPSSVNRTSGRVFIWVTCSEDRFRVETEKFRRSSRCTLAREIFAADVMLAASVLT